MLHNKILKHNNNIHDEEEDGAAERRAGAHTASERQHREPFEGGSPWRPGSSLMDVVVLCHLANQIHPRSVGSIHVPSPAVPKLSMAKCRRNVENFLDACRKIGVPQTSLCSPYDIIQSRLQPLCHAPTSCSLVSVTTQTPPPSWQIWDLIGSSLLHVLCLVLLFLIYSWSELT
ncbi:hypothetical protein KUCAC02_026584 [Chaenocephalus aceratus]|nr:hypothetical protein KUCAC02_026584 [Chaenocephalus aceratus]